MSPRILRTRMPNPPPQLTTLPTDLVSTGDASVTAVVLAIETERQATPSEAALRMHLDALVRSLDATRIRDVAWFALEDVVCLRDVSLHSTPRRGAGSAPRGERPDVFRFDAARRLALAELIRRLCDGRADWHLRGPA